MKRSTSEGQAERARSLASEEKRALNAAIEERDATIARLEHTLAEQQTRIAAQRDALERGKFKTRILEQSYATQLGEARERAAAAEQSVSEQQARIAELEASHEDLTKELAEARAALDSSGLDPVSVDEMLASFDVPRERIPEDYARGAADAPNDPQSVEEMLAPDVMFAGKGK